MIGLDSEILFNSNCSIINSASFSALFKNSFVPLILDNFIFFITKNLKFKGFFLSTYSPLIFQRKLICNPSKTVFQSERKSLKLDQKTYSIWSKYLSKMGYYFWKFLKIFSFLIPCVCFFFVRSVEIYIFCFVRYSHFYCISFLKSWFYRQGKYDKFISFFSVNFCFLWNGK